MADEMSVPSRTDFWGVELTAKKKEAIWDAEEEDDEPRDDPDIAHTLHIQRVILGPNAKDENHLVTMTAQNFAGEDLTHPLCWLSKKSTSESQCSMHMALPPPVTLQLAEGSGPVHVIGIWEQQLEGGYSSDEDEEGDKMDDVMESSSIKPVKDEEAKQKKRPATSPPAKPAKVAKKDEKVSKLAALQKKPIGDQDSEDNEEDEEDEDGEQEDDDDDDDENEEESDEEGEDEEEDSDNEPLPPPKKKPQTKAVIPKQKANMPKSIGDKAAKKPGKGTTPQGTPQGSRSLDELKAMLAKSPNVPKKREKFNNYLQNNLKVTDSDVKKKLWNFMQQSKH